MKSNSFDKNAYRLILRRFRQELVAISIILACIVIFFQVVIPQFQDYLFIRHEEKVVRSRIEAMRNNISLLSNMSNAQLEEYVTSVSSALPIEKDFAGILTAIAASSYNAGVRVDDYAFQVGELSTASAKLTPRPFLQVAIKIDGDIDGGKRFVQELAKHLPLSENLEIDMNRGVAGIATTFYYKPYMPIQFTDYVPLKPFSKGDQQLLRTITEWQQAGATFDFTVGESSTDAAVTRQ